MEKPSLSLLDMGGGGETNKEDSRVSTAERDDKDIDYEGRRENKASLEGGGEFCGMR